MSRNLTQRYLRETEIALARAVSISDVTKIAHVTHGYRLTQASGTTIARPWAVFSDDERTEVTYTPSDRAWFRKPLAAFALAFALACGGSAAHAETTHSPDVIAAQREVTTAKAHLKNARATERAQRKEASKARKVARLRAALAKAEGK